jgi:hypothetical protein
MQEKIDFSGISVVFTEPNVRDYMNFENAIAKFYRVNGYNSATFLSYSTTDESTKQADEVFNSIDNESINSVLGSDANVENLKSLGLSNVADILNNFTILFSDEQVEKAMLKCLEKSTYIINEKEMNFENDTFFNKQMYSFRIPVLMSAYFFFQNCFKMGLNV